MSAPPPSVQRVRNFQFSAEALSRVAQVNSGKGIRPDTSSVVANNNVKAKELPLKPVSGPFEPDPSKIPVLPKIIASTKAPLKVEIERRIRLYGVQDINSLISEEGINLNDLCQDCSDEVSPDHLDLEIFDNHDFESRSWQEWLALGKETNGTPAHAARVRLNRPIHETEEGLVKSGRSLRFESCLVKGYDEVSKRYQIEFSSDKYVTSRPRILVMFKADDPWSFAKRIKYALDLRNQTLAELDYNLFLDSIPVDLLPALPTDQLNRIVSKALSWKRASVYEVGKDNAKGSALPAAIEARKNLIEELNLEYFRALNQCALNHAIKVADPEKDSVVAGLAVPDRSWKHRGQIVMPQGYSFKEARSRFTFQSFLTVPEVLACVNKVKVECFRVASASLFNLSGTTMRPDEFEQLQLTHCESINKLLRETWVNAVRNAIQNSLKDIGKGWFNLAEHRMNVYLQSKLRKLMTQLKFIMQDSLRYLAENSNAAFTKLITVSTALEVEVKAFDEVNITVLGASADAKRPPPLFVLDVMIAPKTNKLYLSHDLDVVKALPLRLFDAATNIMQGILNLEPQVLSNMFWPEKTTLSAPDRNDPAVADQRKRISRAMDEAIKPLYKYMESLAPLEAVLQIDTAAVIKQWEASTPEAIAAQLQSYQAKRNLMDEKIPKQIAVGCFTVVTDRVRKSVVAKYIELIEGLGGAIATSTRKKAEAVSRSFEEIFSTLRRTPNTIEEIVEAREYAAGLQPTLNELKVQVEQAFSNYDLLDGLFYSYSNSDMKQRWHIFELPHVVQSRILEAQKMYTTKESDLDQEQTQVQEDFNDEIKSMDKIVKGFAVRTVPWKLGTGVEGNALDSVADEVTRMMKRLSESETTARTFNSRELLFGKPQTDYSDIARVAKAFEPYSNLWLAMRDFQNAKKRWMTDPFNTLDAEEIEKSISTWWRTVFKACKTLQDGDAELLEMANTVKKDMEEFKNNVPIVVALRLPGMRDRHWKKLSEEIKMDINLTGSVTLHDVLYSMQLPRFMQQITTVGDFASKEYLIEKTLEKMTSSWVGVNLDLVDYRDTGTQILRGLDEIMQQLDDNIVMTQSIAFSPFKGPFEQDIETWEKKLLLAQEILDEWVACQRLWLYLEPIFGSEDIQKQLPGESKKFQAVDRNWRRTVELSRRNPAVLECCSTQRMLDTFKDGNKILDSVQKGLSDYLETKRAGFARFYFLSDNELLSILSQTKEVTAVQPHLKKCFEAISKLEFVVDGRNVSATAMYSAEKEMILWPEVLHIRGTVESWLTDVESSMRSSLRHRLREATDDYVTKPRTQWVLEWPGQLVLAASQYYWSIEVGQSIDTEGALGMKHYLEKMLTQLDGLVSLVRGQLSYLQSLTLGALIVIEVHARDVIQHLEGVGIKSTSDFEWISQLRYYWDDESYVSKKAKLPLFYDAGRGMDMTVKQVQAVFVYGYEYLGNTPRLVITPLTDRCYITLTAAMHICLGGAPQGPAGTGKTEVLLPFCCCISAFLTAGYSQTTKDLGKALAKQTVVFNCSDGLDYLAMGKFFKGLASSGAWACFDEFNRIDVEVLSVIAQQVITIQLATQAAKKNFTFEGCDIALDCTSAVFITMNGYAGRTELPDNLKALFRPMAMMVPDYGLIAEISLFSFGFSAARPLSKKIVATFKLSSEQLSSQDHYDFGMRAVKTVINASGILKRKQPTDNEEILLYRALQDVNKPKFLKEDLLLFDGIMSDLFPGIQKPEINYGRLMDSLAFSCRMSGLQPEESFLNKTIQLYDTTVVRHGLMLVGPTGGGKTCNYRTLAAAMTLCKDQIDVCQAVADLKTPLEQAFKSFDPEDTGYISLEAFKAGLSSALPNLARTFENSAIENLFKYVDTSNDNKIDIAEFTEGLKNIASATFEQVHYYSLNPKSITSGQLYGDFDENTHEWTDGILAGMIRECAQDTGPDKQWVMFDGPVDAIWIENMNTVLDDNKLCLVSGEIIALSPPMTMMFEVEDLAVASPATVSRCGMIYMEPAALGIRALCVSWLQTLPQSFADFAGTLQEMFDLYVPHAVTFVRKQLTETVATVDGNLVLSMFRIYDAVIHLYTKQSKEVSDDDEKKGNPIPPKEAFRGIFFFSLIWSVGASCDLEGRRKFNTKIREIAASHNHDNLIPAKGSIYDYCYMSTYKTPDWCPWMNTRPEFKLDPRTPFDAILVPTVDTLRYAHIVGVLVQISKHVLAVGNTGTGKTLVIMEKLLNGLGKGFDTIPMAFSASTSANQTQDLLDGKLDKRRKGVFGPPAGTRFVIMVDDFNMPAREKYFAQPPIELLRQWMDHSGWYDRKTLQFREIIDLVFVAAMGPPGGGRNPITARMLRHFSFISFTTIENESLERIFGTVLESFIGANFVGEEFSALTTKIVKSTIDIYDTIARELLPTPAKSHYTFNLRDLAKVFQGILCADPKSIKEANGVVRLWCHECLRVFADRLVSAEDRQWFSTLQERQLEEHFQSKWTDICGSGRLLYGDYTSSGDPKPYIHIEEPEKLFGVFETFLEDYNAEATKRMDLVLFMDAVDHISRISRIIRQPKGNALLLGVGGSGRQSLTRLAAYAAEYKCFQIEITKGYGMAEWREDIRKVLKQAGSNAIPTVFLFADTQILKEQFLEDVNSILNSGEVPNIFDSAAQEEIADKIRPVCQQLGIALTKANINAQFLKRVQSNLHCVICMSPASDIFRSRLRMYPSLLNCCSIDWFSEWPAEALTNVARNQLASVEFSTAEQRNAVFEMCRCIHQSVAEHSLKYLAEMQRHNAVTPTSYLELLNSYKKLMAGKKAEVEGNKRRFVVGLEKLEDATVQVNALKEKIIEMQPILERTSVEVEQMMVSITADREEADKVRSVVEVQKKEADIKAKEAKDIADDAQRDLDEALPALEAATASLRSLKKDDIVEVKAMKNPPAGVRITMEAVCILMKVKPVRKDDPNQLGKKINDYWEPATKLLNEPQTFLDSLTGFNKDAIEAPTIASITPIVNGESGEFTPSSIEKASKACKSICMWCLAMHKYYHVARMVEPKKQLLNSAQAELKEVMVQLDEAERKLNTVKEKLARLEADLNAAVAKKEQLSNQSEECNVKLIRAEKLIGGLGGEKVRWIANVGQLETDLTNLVGDVLVAAGSVAYLGAFIGDYRSSMVDEWNSQLEAANVPHLPGCDLQTTMADPVSVRAWQIAGLPSDKLSTENALIMRLARRWPLMIDPETQANQWIKNLERAQNLEVIKISSSTYLRSLENGIRFGRPVLLENIGEELDPALEPVLLRITFKQSGQEMIQLGDSCVPWHSDFKFFMTTKLRNPIYQPETAVKVTLLNFAITSDGLQQQLLGLVVSEERPDLSEAKNNLVVQNAAMKKQMKEIEDTILRMLSEASGDILDDESLINTLSESKKTSIEINTKLAEAEVTEAEIDQTRVRYVPVAYRSSLLYFCVSDLCVIDPMYQYSLGWFMSLFRLGIQKAEQAEDLGVRLDNIISYFTYSVYVNVCRSLFEKHKLMFSFLLCVRIMNGDKRLDAEEFKFLLSGPPTTATDGPNPAPTWLTNNSWIEISGMSSQLPAFAGFSADFRTHVADFKRIFDSLTPESEPIPAGWEEKLTPLQKMLVVRGLRLDKVTNAVQGLVSQEMGTAFIEPPPFDLQRCYADSTVRTPLIFVFSPGSDPASDLYKFAGVMNMSRKLDAISLGQGQGPIAEKMIQNGCDSGGWVFLQNCHLAVSWMPRLEKIVETTDENLVHKDYRLWLTSEPSPNFPVAVLQDGVKMTIEPPKGLKANLIRSFVSFTDEFLEDCSKPKEWRSLLFCLCFYHAVVQDRRKFGSLGWNIAYDFAQSDLSICTLQLRIFLNEYEVIPFKVLQYLFSEINYGGRITDDKDRRVNNVLLQDYICKEVLAHKYKLSPSGIYYVPNSKTQADILEHLKQLPITPGPEIFGLHDNADITSAQNETLALFENIVAMQPRTSSGKGKSRDEVVGDWATDILKRIPETIPIDAVVEKYPTTYSESMNTVLTQEVIRYNNLTRAMCKSLKDLKKALKGLVVMSDSLDRLGTSLFNNQVPDMWASVGYPSLMPLASWVVDLEARLSTVNKWIEGGHPAVYWISGFFFPQAFLTGILQNYARKTQEPIDAVSYGFEILSSRYEDLKEKPEFGCYIRGLFLEGARWDSQEMTLAESRPKELFTGFPCIWLIPVVSREKPTQGIYNCPVYKTLTRAGTLSTTGHSTNFVLWLEVPSQISERHWVKRAVALFCGLKY